MVKATVVRSGNLIIVSPPFKDLLSSHLSFKKRVQNGGDPSRATYVPTDLYSLTEDGCSLITPAGMTARVMRVLKQNGVEVEFEDMRTDRLPEPDFSKLDKLRPEQIDILSKILAHDWLTVEAPTGCHAAGTRVRLRDGSTKAVEDVVAGDVLLGPDSDGRRVVRLYRGTQEMFEITPVKGTAFVVNADHVLALRRTNDGKYKGATQLFITVRDYLSRSHTCKHLHKLEYAHAVEFARAASALPLDPYFLGVYLGNGGSTASNVHVTTNDDEIVVALRGVAAQFGLGLSINRKLDQQGNTYIFSQDVDTRKQYGNEVRERLRALRLLGLACESKFVPDDYKFGTATTRRELLAGLIDTDGYLGNGTFEYSSKSPHLTSDVVCIARSLGLAAYASPKIVNGETYYRVSISGDCSSVPTRVRRKIAADRRQKKCVRVTGFTVKSAGVGQFYGFELDKDHLYLTDDYVIHHNSGKSFLVKQLCKLWSNSKILICCPFSSVLNQTLEELRAEFTAGEVGLVGLGSRETGCRITLTTDRSLHKCDLDGTRLFIYDECHRGASDACASVIGTIRNAKHIGFSASPYGRSDGGDLETEALFGPCVCKISYEDVQATGSVVPIEVRMFRCNDIPKYEVIDKGSLERRCLWRHDGRNAKICRAVTDILEELGNVQVMISVKTVDHAVHLHKYLPDFALAYATMDKEKMLSWKRNGFLPDDYEPLKREDLVTLQKGFREGTVRRAIATGVWGTGANFPQLTVLVRADAQSGDIASTQIPGRVTRKISGKDCGYVIDFLDEFNSVLSRRALQRKRGYGKKGWTVIEVD